MARIVRTVEFDQHASQVVFPVVRDDYRLPSKNSIPMLDGGKAKSLIPHIPVQPAMPVIQPDEGIKIIEHLSFELIIVAVQRG